MRNSTAAGVRRAAGAAVWFADPPDCAVEAIISVGKPLFSAEQDTSELTWISRFTDRSSSAVIIQGRTGEVRFAIAIRLQSAPRAVVARHS